MSYSPRFSPDNDARPVGKLFTRQLSQRDLSLSVPVNYVEHAGISLTAACFAHNRYLAEPAQICFSNLLVIGFHRYEVDVYWDVGQQSWSLCPVQLGGRGSPAEASPTTSVAGPVSTSEGQTGLSVIAMTSEMAPGGSALAERDGRGRQRRQETATAPALDATGLSPASSISTAVDADETSLSLADPTTTPGADIVTSEASDSGAAGSEQTAGFECSEAVDLNWLSRILWTYLDTTETNLNATLRYLILNVHAAASGSGSANDANEPSSEALPGPADSLSTVLSANLSSFLYTPPDLGRQRANVNESWFDVLAGMDPTSGYYVLSGPDEARLTQDGWPTESYVEMQEGKRLLVGFGSIDPQMEGYDVSRDYDVIFPQDYLQDPRRIAVGGQGQVDSGCFFTPNEYSVGNLNNSWSVTTDPDLPDSEELPSLSSTTRCGISPILNTTLQNSTADQNFLPYQEYLQSTIWAWAPDYPLTSDSSTFESDSRNQSESNSDPGGEARCAALNATSGFWQNIICDDIRYSACRMLGSVYQWSISGEAASYTKAGVTCGDGAEFDVPRTGLQNAYLLAAWRARLQDPAVEADQPRNEMLWVNFNNLDSELCWVAGQNSTCPYVNRRSGDRQVIVPVVAAIVVFVLGVMTVFVKCAANRRMNKRRKRRRRGDDGWDYEGVPS